MRYKFRAYSLSTGKWYELDPYNVDESDQFRGSLRDLAESDTWKVVMWTGLHDKNGTEIYEGDICRTHYWPKNEDGSTTLSDRNKRYKNIVIEYGYKKPFVGFVIHDWYEVIGNIYQHPELINRR